MIGKFKVGPILLILLGTIFLLNNFGILPWNIWNNLWRFWPVIIILIGVEYLVGKTISLKTAFFLLLLIFLIPLVVAINPFTNNPLATDTLQVEEELGTITKAKIILEMPATNLEIKSSTSSATLAEGEIKFSKAAKEPKVETEESLGQKIVRITQENVPGLPFISSLRNHTKLTLSNQIPIELQITTEASRQNLNLESMRVDYLEVNSKASDLNLVFGNTYSSRAKINTSASNLNITIPKDIEARIKVDSKVKNLTIDENRYQDENGVYKTEDFDKAFTRIDIQVEAIAGSITIK